MEAPVKVLSAFLLFLMPVISSAAKSEPQIRVCENSQIRMSLGALASEEGYRLQVDRLDFSVNRLNVLPHSFSDWARIVIFFKRGRCNKMSYCDSHGTPEYQAWNKAGEPIQVQAMQNAQFFVSVRFHLAMGVVESNRELRLAAGTDSIRCVPAI
jgi:hypothetical protein